MDGTQKNIVDIVNIVKFAEVKLKSKFNLDNLVRVSRPNYKKDVVDSVSIIRVRAQYRKDNAILLVSSKHHPDAVSSAIGKIYQVLKAVPPGIQGPILQPIFSGCCQGRSFAFFSELRPFSNYRLIAKIQKNSVEKSINYWLAELCSHTKVILNAKEDIQSRFLEPLTYVVEQNRFSEQIRLAAKNVLAEILEGNFQPVSAIQHGDFWVDNVLLNKGWPLSIGKQYSFSVIDWGTTNQTGYPIVDLLKYALSTTNNNRRIADHIDAYCAHCDLPQSASIGYLCASIGWLGLHPYHFPMDRYISSSQKLFDRYLQVTSGV